MNILHMHIFVFYLIEPFEMELFLYSNRMVAVEKEKKEVQYRYDILGTARRRKIDILFSALSIYRFAD